MKILHVVGTRPQFIKCSVVTKAISKFSSLKQLVVNTGQHYDENMSSIFLENIFEKQEFLHLSLAPSPPVRQIGEMILELEGVFNNHNPDLILLYGDTSTTIAGAIASNKMGVCAAHIEAGVRSFNKQMPEEINRLVTDQLSQFHFVTGGQAKKNLLNEGVPDSSIFVVGDVMYDAALQFVDDDNWKLISQKYGINKRDYILATIHRANNTSDIVSIRNIFLSLSNLAKFKKILLPVHPRTLNIIQENGGSLREFDKIRFIDALGYAEMLTLEKWADSIVTDSGGVQKEAFFFGVPCFVMREETEWVELTETGSSCLTNSENLLNDYSTFVYQRDDKLISSVFGDGKASTQIAKIISGLKLM